MCENIEIDWQVHKKKNSERGKYILETGLWTDCKFIFSLVQPKKHSCFSDNSENQLQEIKAHKLILSMASPVFEKMFQNGLNRSENDVELTDIQPDVFESVLNYIYTEEIKILSFDGACEIYYVAHKYMLPELMEQCEVYLMNNVDSTNACYGYELAKLFNITELKTLCKTIITSETINVVKNESFKVINLSTLKMILKENSLNITELELFKAVERWIVANVDMKKNCDGNHLAELSAEIMPLLCFLKMTPEEFVEGPAVSNLLSKDDSYAVLINIISPLNCKFPLPNGFSNMLRKKPVQKLKTNVQTPFTFSSLSLSANQKHDSSTSKMIASTRNIKMCE